MNEQPVSCSVDSPAWTAGVDSKLAASVNALKAMLRPLGIEVRGEIMQKSPLPDDWTAAFKFSMLYVSIRPHQKFGYSLEIQSWQFVDGRFQERLEEMGCQVMLSLVREIAKQAGVTRKDFEDARHRNSATGQNSKPAEATNEKAKSDDPVPSYVPVRRIDGDEADAK